MEHMSLNLDCILDCIWAVLFLYLMDKEMVSSSSAVYMRVLVDLGVPVEVVEAMSIGSPSREL